MIAENFELSGNPPVAPGHFTGRQAELARIESGLLAAHVALVEGMPGIGKTALLAELATLSFNGYGDRRERAGSSGSRSASSATSWNVWTRACRPRASRRSRAISPRRAWPTPSA